MNKNILDKINRILYEEWDPIGVKNLEGSEGEYAAYAFKIFILINSISKKEKILDYLTMVEAEIIGLDPNIEKNQKISEKLYQLKKLI